MGLCPSDWNRTMLFLKTFEVWLIMLVAAFLNGAL
jgi:hypothetical protein